MPFFDIKEGSGWFVTLRITAETPRKQGIYEASDFTQIFI